MDNNVMDENSAINKAFILAHENKIAAYAIEGKYGWSVSDRKPSLRYGKVWECHSNGGKHYA